MYIYLISLIVCWIVALSILMTEHNPLTEHNPELSIKEATDLAQVYFIIGLFPIFNLFVAFFIVSMLIRNIISFLLK